MSVKVFQYHYRGILFKSIAQEMGSYPQRHETLRAILNATGELATSAYNKCSVGTDL